MQLAVYTQDLGVRVSSLAAVGTRMWVGLHDGRVSVLDAAPGLSPAPLTTWAAHDMCVISLALAGTRVFSLGADGSIKAWAATSPGEHDVHARCEQKPVFTCALTSASA